MFVPEVYIKHWDTFWGLLKTSKVRVFKRSGYGYIQIQCLKDGVVFSHRQPESFNVGDGEYDILGQKITIGEILKLYEAHRAREIDAKEYDRLRYKTLQTTVVKGLQSFLAREKLTLFEGEFASLVMVGEEWD